MSNEIRFEPLPESARADLSAIANQLRARPGEWAHIGTRASAGSARQGAYQVRGRNEAFAPAGAFEAASRTVDGEHRIYARYVGATYATATETP